MELLRMEHIQKSFYGITVLDDVSFHVNAGEVHALLGENGAGKSTLMNILAGVYKRDSGTIFFAGKSLTNGSIQDAEIAGIAFVHQELNIFNDLKVYENLFLGKELTTSYGMLKKKAMIQETRALMHDLGIDINPREAVDQLSTGKKQLLEIAKALHANAKLIILDEPTTALNQAEINKFFDIIRNLRKKRTSFIFISHKMPEIFKIADSYTVLRNSRYIESGKITETTPEKVTKLMVGESYCNNQMYQIRVLGDPILQLEQLSGNGFSDINLSLKKGEIVGFTGLQGAGCSEVLQAIFGVVRLSGGTIIVDGERILKHSIHHAMKHKIAMVAANRKENSILPDMNLLENMYISEHAINTKKQYINKREEVNKYINYREMLNIKAESYHTCMTSLSGGNQQKVILARWLNTQAEILLFDNPTQGIDVGAKDEIYKLILALSKQGKTIIVNTLEIPEIQKIADRCIVFYQGKIAAELKRNDMNEETVMLYATNAVFNL